MNAGTQLGEHRDLATLFSLKGRLALVVGAGSGIGRAASEGLAAHGARVICADVSPDSAAETSRLITAAGGSSDAADVDIRDEASIASLLSAYATPEVLVMTPSINVRKRLSEISDDEAASVVSLNLLGTLRMVRAVSRPMADRGSGSVIVFSSIRAKVVEPGQGIYAATKAGVLQLMRVFAAELGPAGVRFNVIAPGVVETPLTRPIMERREWYEAYAQKTVLRRWAQPEEMVGAVVFLASDASSYVTGSYLLVDGGWTAVDGRFDPPL